MFPPFLLEPSLALPMVLVAVIGGYLSGSVPYGLVLTKLAGLGDIRNAGSGNIGTTNVMRVGGKKLALLTLLLDALKAAVPVLVAKHFSMDYAVLAAIAAFLGHLFPVWLKFKGGKGVASALGICMAFSPAVGLSLFAIWIVVFAATKYSSLSAMIACAMAPVSAWFITHDMQITATLTLVAVLIVIKHHENIRRLVMGTESKIHLGKK